MYYSLNYKGYGSANFWHIHDEELQKWIHWEDELSLKPTTAGVLFGSLFDPEDGGHVPSKRRSLSELNVSTTRNSVLFIDTTVRTLNTTCTYYNIMSVRPSESNIENR
jgi:hypothetical protein